MVRSICCCLGELGQRVQVAQLLLRRGGGAEAWRGTRRSRRRCRRRRRRWWRRRPARGRRRAWSSMQLAAAGLRVGVVAEHGEHAHQQAAQLGARSPSPATGSQPRSASTGRDQRGDPAAGTPRRRRPRRGGRRRAGRSAMACHTARSRSSAKPSTKVEEVGGGEAAGDDFVPRVVDQVVAIDDGERVELGPPGGCAARRRRRRA